MSSELPSAAGAACVRACVRACARARVCVRAYVRACVRACVRVCVCAPAKVIPNICNQAYILSHEASSRCLPAQAMAKAGGALVKEAPLGAPATRVQLCKLAARGCWSSHHNEGTSTRSERQEHKEQRRRAVPPHPSWHYANWMQGAWLLQVVKMTGGAGYAHHPGTECTHRPAGSGRARPWRALGGLRGRGGGQRAGHGEAQGAHGGAGLQHVLCTRALLGIMLMSCWGTASLLGLACTKCIVLCPRQMLSTNALLGAQY